ncbi:MAG: prepilin-type N-terminal cleavage/methylation domain-containing protein [Planctomycetota bacterium]|nr:prepilin-type N-terminal cleavage/methylation domain-containing protein [Planctomycetota bacterium]
MNTPPLCDARGFTLIESLAVVVLLALVVGVVAASLAPAADRAAMDRAASAVLDADARARAIARRGEPVELRVADGSVWVRLAQHAPALVTRQLPAATTIELTSTVSGTPLGVIRFDARGRSPDYIFTVHSGERSTRTLVAGLTGSTTTASEITP